MKVYIPDVWGDSRWGIARGYVHIFEKFSAGLATLGAEVTHDPDADVDIDLFVTTPGCYRRRREASVLYTMWENTEIDPDHLEKLKLADRVIVPSTWCKEIFEKHHKAQTSVVPLAIDPIFTRRKRKLKGRFRWLFVGASNYRKGIDVIDDVWAHLLNNPSMELYMKTTGGSGVDQGIFQTDNNVIVDTRRVEPSQLVDIYHSADGFLFPTAGEGFGLTLAEAMSTGLPCICTKYSGHLDFTDESSVFYVELDRGGKRPAANAVDLAKQMKRVMNNYRRALLKGRAASKAVSRLTWDNSCRGVYTILSNMLGGMNNG